MRKMAKDPNKPSPVEGIKSCSTYLRGNIPDEIRSDEDHFSKDNTQLLKHFGTYQQDNRDERSANRAAGGGKSYMFMVRTRIPGGKLTSDQLMAELDLCDELGNNTLRVTTRQGLQLHGVVKSNLERTIARINEIQLTTLGACGDVERNVMCCPAPHFGDDVHNEMQRLADALAHHLRLHTPAYHELWLTNLDNGDKHLAGGGLNGQAGPYVATGRVAAGDVVDDVEPIYGQVYLPRKFKTAIGLPGDNCIDIYTNDLGFLGICRDWKIIGYNVLVGGGQGTTPTAAKTFPALAKRMAFVRPEQAVDVAEAIVKVQRDFGNRSDRKVARLKYLIAEWGVEKFKAKVEEYCGEKLDDPVPDDVHGFDDHMGWAEQGDGKLFYGLNIENGRIKDEGDFRLKTALRQISEKFNPSYRLTAHQSILVCGLEPDARPELEQLLKNHGVPLTEEISNARRWSMACVAWPTCGLSITESERALPGIIDELEAEVAKLGLDAEKYTIRMTGCPNGCARPYNCDIGIVGKAAGKYTLLLGGRLLGDRLNSIYKDLVPAEDVVVELAAVFACFKQLREEGESFGDFCHRQGNEALQAWTEQYLAAQQAS